LTYNLTVLSSTLFPAESINSSLEDDQAVREKQFYQKCEAFSETPSMKIEELRKFATSPLILKTYKIFLEAALMKNIDEASIKERIDFLFDHWDNFMYFLPFPPGEISGFTSVNGRIFIRNNYFSGSEILIKAACLVTVIHEITHFLLRVFNSQKLITDVITPQKIYILKKEFEEEIVKQNLEMPEIKSLEFKPTENIMQKGEKCIECDDAGDFLEIILFSRSFNVVYESQARFLLDILNFKLNLPKFREEFLKLIDNIEENEAFLRFKTNNKKDEGNCIRKSHCVISLIRSQK